MNPDTVFPSQTLGLSTFPGSRSSSVQACLPALETLNSTPDIGPMGCDYASVDLPHLVGLFPTNPPPCLDSILPPHEIIVHLVEVYFESVQPQFHLLHRPTFLYQLHCGSLMTEEYSCILLNAMFALASRYTDDPRVHAFDLSLNGGPLSTEHVENPRSTRMRRWEQGKGYMQQAKRLFKEKDTQLGDYHFENGQASGPCLFQIQAIALLSYAELAMGTMIHAHGLISTSVRLAYDAELDKVDSAVSLKAPNFSVPLTSRLPRTRWAMKEELRHVWWCIWELATFVCSIRCQPVMVNPMKCETKLPVDDVAWFEGNEAPSCFLPRHLSQWRNLKSSWPCTSVLANRIVALYFVMIFFDLVDDGNLDLFDSYSEIVDCLKIWRDSLPPILKSEHRSQSVLQLSSSSSEVFPLYILCEQ